MGTKNSDNVLEDAQRLAFLYVNNHRLFAGLQANFVSGLEFEFKLENGKPLLSVKLEEKLTVPTSFFTTSKVKSQQNIWLSAIIGKNGSGKTTIARVISDLLNEYELDDARNRSNGEYLMVFSANNTADSYSVYYHLSDYDLTLDASCIDQYSQFCGKQMKFTFHNLLHEAPNLDYAYYSPCYSSVHRFPENGINVHDISTSGILRQYAETNSVLDALCAYDTHDTIGILIASHKLRKIASQYEIDTVAGVSKVTIQPQRMYWSRLAEMHGVMDGQSYANFTDAMVTDDEIDQLKLNVFCAFFGAYVKDQWRHKELRAHTKSLLRLVEDAANGSPSHLNDLVDSISRYGESIKGESKYDKQTKNTIKSIVKVMDLLSLCNDSTCVSVGKESITFEFGKDLKAVSQVADFLEAYAHRGFDEEYLQCYFNPEISSGEFAFLSLWGRLCRLIDGFGSRRELPQRPLLLFLDEVETQLHPEWQRELVHNTLAFFQNIVRDRSVHIIFASHSPVLLSDIPKGNVVGLKKLGDHSEASLSKITNTFAANIFDLYKDSFFLDHGTMGEFATSKVDALLEKLNPPRKNYKTEKEYLAALRKVKETITPDDRKIAELIGDPFLSRYIHRRFDELGIDYDTPEDEMNGAINGDEQ